MAVAHGLQLLIKSHFKDALMSSRNEGTLKHSAALQGQDPLWA